MHKTLLVSFWCLEKILKKIVWLFFSDIANLCLLSFSLHQSCQRKKSLRVSFRFLQIFFFKLIKH